MEAAGSGRDSGVRLCWHGVPAGLARQPAQRRVGMKQACARSVRSYPPPLPPLPHTDLGGERGQGDHDDGEAVEEDGGANWLLDEVLVDVLAGQLAPDRLAAGQLGGDGDEETKHRCIQGGRGRGREVSKGRRVEGGGRGRKRSGLGAGLGGLGVGLSGAGACKDRFEGPQVGLGLRQARRRRAGR